jgi:hypothetical protein
MKTIKSTYAKKLSSMGVLDFHLKEDSDKNIYIQIEKNHGGKGKFSREDIPFSSIYKLLKEQSDKAIKSKTFDPLFTNKSNNNAGFLAAVLRHQGILAKEGNYHLIVHDALATWKDKLLGVGGESDSQH